MKPALFCAGIAGLSGVLLGAFGAHALKETLSTHGTAAIWETAVFYQLTHSVAAFVVALFIAQQPSPPASAGLPWIARASTAWLIGLSLFSGSLYLLALGGPRWLGPVTPLGGIFLLSGWVFVLIGACKSPVTSKS